MDKQTIELRRRNKAAYRQAREANNGLMLKEAYGLGRKAKPNETFPLKQCEHITGGKAIFLKKRKQNPKPLENPYYSIRIIKGGKKCPRLATVRKSNGTNLCLEHLGGESN